MQGIPHAAYTVVPVSTFERELATGGAAMTGTEVYRWKLRYQILMGYDDSAASFAAWRRRI